MKLLIFNGSPKREHSDTMHITNAFVNGMKESCDVESEVIHVTDKHIEYCHGCFNCKRNGGKCIHNDDMNDILQKILESDILLFNFPLYCYSMPAPLKNLLDRTMPLSSMQMKKVGDRYEHTAQADYTALKYIMICGCGFPNSKHNFEPAVMQFKLCFPNNHTILTIPESPMFNAPEAVEVTSKRLELVKKAGEEYVKYGEITKSLLDEICSPMIPENIYAKIANGEL